MIDIILETSRPGDTSGIKLAQEIRRISKYFFTPILFITGLEEPEIYAYKQLRCFDYIEKPFDTQYVLDQITRALEFSTAHDKDETLFFRKDGIIFPVKCSDIKYIESQSHILHIHTVMDSTLEIPYITCKQVMKDINNDSFFQCSRSTVVNKKYIKNIDLTNKYIMMNDGKQIDIGITFVKAIREDLGI